MNSRHTRILGALTCALAIGACRNKPDVTVGSVSLPLQAAAASGNIYQLRNATFLLVGGASTVTLSSASSPDTATALVAPNLPVGSYTAELLPGWTMVRVLAGAPVQSVQAALLSANPTSFSVASMTDTTVGFAFEAQGDVVDTSQGNARIVITVTERDGGAADGGSPTDAGTPPADGGMCSPSGGPCGKLGEFCCAGLICPTNSFTCIACRQLDQSCGQHSDCCGNSCVNGRCTDGSCSQAGGPCNRTGGTCCAGTFCLNTTDTCQACRGLTQTCTAHGECCSNSCVNGRCTDGSCSPVDGPCGRTGGTCCAGLICPVGADICQACRQTAQTCGVDADCCAGNTCVSGRCAQSTLTAPTFLGAGAGAAGTGDLAIPYPAGVGAGQLLMLQLGSRGGNVPVTPAGWTLLWFDERPNPRQRIYWKLATAADAGTLAVTMGLSNVNVGRMYAFGGVTSAATFFESAVITGADLGTLPGPTVTCGGTGRLAVDFVALDSNPLLEPMVGETGGDWVEAVPEFSSDIGSNFAIQLQIAPMPAGGTISGGSANLGGGGDACVGRAFALIGR
jgi:hypothetical protein